MDLSSFKLLRVYLSSRYLSFFALIVINKYFYQILSKSRRIVSVLFCISFKNKHC